MTTIALELPIFTYRNVTSLQFLDGARRITRSLLDLEDGLPLTDELCRELATDGSDAVAQLALRMDDDRKGKFTEQKRRLDRDRRTYYQAIRRGVLSILKDPDPELPAQRLQAAQELSDVLAKRKKGFAAKTQAETSSELLFFFEDCAPPAIQHAFKQTDLLRYYRPLQTAHNAFQDVLRKEEISETNLRPSGAGDTTPIPEATPLTRELKETITSSLDLAFEIMAHHARRHREPYAALLSRCTAIAGEINTVAKTRETRTRNAEAKKTKEKATSTEPAPRTSGVEAGRPTATAKSEGLAS